MGFRLSNGVYTWFSGPGASFFVYGNNDAGQVVGYYPWNVPIYTLNGCLDVVKTINFPGAKNSIVYDINNIGQMVGSYQDSAGVWHGFSFDGQTYISLDIPGASNTWACGINDNGNFVGYYGDSAGMHGYASLTAPVANAGSNQTGHPGATVTLDGSGSNDPGGNVPLTYAWKFTTKPYGSKAALFRPRQHEPKFHP